MGHRRALAAVLAVAAFAGTLALYRSLGGVTVDFERGYEGAFVDGFHPRERAGAAYFRWTDDASYLVLEDLPGEGRLSVTARLKTIRPAGAPLPELAFTMNGITVHRARAGPGDASYRFDVPAPGGALRLGIESETFEASGGRRLGVQVLSVHVEPAGGGGLRPALLMALAALLWLFAASVAGLAPIAAALAAGLLEGVFLFLLAQGPVPHSGYPSAVVVLALGGLAAAALLRFAFARAGWLHPRDRSTVVAVLTLLLVVEVGLVTYPLTLSSDADFQANRMSELLAGHWHPSSVTQHEPPFRIPYPVSLFVVAAPLVTLGLDRVSALELVLALSDVLVSGLLIYLAWRFFDDLRAGLIAGALYQHVPMNGLAFSAGNFTNLFAVSMLALGFTALVASHASGDVRAASTAAIAALVGVTAHFGMLLEGAVLWPVWLGGLWLLPVPVRDTRRFATLAVTAAFVLALAYYAGYFRLIASQWERALSGGGTPGREGANALALLGVLLGEQLGWVFLLTAFFGTLAIVRRPLDGALHVCATGWLLVTLLFLVVELVTPVEIRYWLQALPLLALASGLYLSRALERGGAGRFAALAALLYVAAIGVRNLYEIALHRYH